MVAGEGPTSELSPEVSTTPADAAPDLPPTRRRITTRSVVQAVVGARSMSWLAKLPLWTGTLVLGYHRMHREGEGTEFDPGALSATPAALADQLEFISRYFEVVSPAEIAEQPESSRRRVVITFDDGYRDNYDLALPVLRAHGVPATFFLATRRLDAPSVPWWDELAWMVKQSARHELEPGEWLDGSIRLEGDRRGAIRRLADAFKTLPSERTDAFLEFCGEAAGTGRCDPERGRELWMTWEMAAELSDAGMTIGGHSASHPVLGRSNPDVQRREIEECAARLDEELGIPMRHFAYPVGLPTSFDDVTRRILEEVGVELAFSLYGGYVPAGRFDPYDVPRTSVSTGEGAPSFRARLALPRLFARW